MSEKARAELRRRRWLPSGVTPHLDLVMIDVEDDDEPDGLPWPFRKDGRMNPWYIRKADQCERHQSQGAYTVYGGVIDDPSADH